MTAGPGPDYMVYGELGRYPISIDIKVRIIKFWCKLIMGKQSKLSHICFKLLYNNIYLRDGFSLLIVYQKNGWVMLLRWV